MVSIKRTFPKLSQAIHFGCTLHPMVRGSYFMAEGEDAAALTVAGTCAMGAAYEAIYGPEHALAELNVVHAVASGVEYDFVETAIDYPPDLSTVKGSGSVHDVVTWMNDIGNYSREQIADYLASQGL